MSRSSIMTPENYVVSTLGKMHRNSNIRFSIFEVFYKKFRKIAPNLLFNKILFNFKNFYCSEFS